MSEETYDVEVLRDCKWHFDKWKTAQQLTPLSRSVLGEADPQELEGHRKAAKKYFEDEVTKLGQP